MRFKDDLLRHASAGVADTQKPLPDLELEMLDLVAGLELSGMP